MKSSLGRRLAKLPTACILVVGFGICAPSQAQSSCSSDGQPRPTALLERFINADCKACWADAGTPRAGRRELALDWVLPGSQGDDAPLSAVATRDARKRLEGLSAAPAAASGNIKTPVNGQAGELRVAHGLPVSGYVGASIEFTPLKPEAAAQSWSAWLALVEILPTGTEGTPVARHLVRNLVQVAWKGREQRSTGKQMGFAESRSMNIPVGMDTGRMRVIGWVQDAKGRVVAAAQSRCPGR
jgi:hypothetical protein